MNPKNQGKYHLVSLFLIPLVFASYMLGGIFIGISVTVFSGALILLVFKK